MAQIEHHCCAATLVMKILGGAEVNLDERLELNEGKLLLYFCCSKNTFAIARKDDCLTYIFQSSHVHFFNGWDEKRKEGKLFGQQSVSNKT